MSFEEDSIRQQLEDFCRGINYRIAHCEKTIAANQKELDDGTAGDSLARHVARHMVSVYGAEKKTLENVKQLLAQVFEEYDYNEGAHYGH